MHLAIVSPYPPNITGIGQYGYHVSRLLAHSGIFARITVLTGATQGKTALEVPPPLQIRPAWQPESINTGWEIFRQLKALQPDVVWFNLGASVFGRSPIANLSGFFGPLCARRMDIPTVVTLHELVELADLQTLNAPGGPLAAHGARLLTRIGLQADVVCLTMRHYTDWLAIRQPNLPCVHIPIGAYYQPELLPASDEQELLFFTTLAPFKGLGVLLEAFCALQPHYPDLHLTIAGAEHARFPGYARRLRKQYDRLPGIRWLGQVPEEQVRGLFQRAQIVTLPYNASTGSSSILYQAATWGRPVVASDLPETRTIVAESGLDVTFFERGNPASLAEALRAQLDSPNLRRQQMEHNFAAIQRYRPEDTCRAYLQAFNLALAARRSPKRIVTAPEMS
jgi:glycosyltransferase involved in cell wall biosynthesis